MQHEGSAYLSTRKAIEAAEDRGFDAGREIGRAEGRDERAAMDIEFLDSMGFRNAADALRRARVTERDDG